MPAILRAKFHIGGKVRLLKSKHPISVGSSLLSFHAETFEINALDCFN